MSATTTNLGLKLYAPTAEDAAVLEKDFKLAIAGTGNTSNFAKIDAAYGSLLTKVNNIPVLNKISLTKTGDNAYKATVSGITAYSTALFFLFFFPEQTTGTTTITINDLSPKELKHYTDGAKVQMGAGDIKSGVGYVVHYDGTDFVLDSDDPNLYAKIALKADADDVGDINSLTTAQKGSVVLAINDLDANKAAKTHAGQHKSTGNDPLTPNDIGAAPAAHAEQHKSTGSDPLTANDIGAVSSDTFAELAEQTEAHTTNTGIHVTASDKTAWNKKASGTHASQHASDGADPVTPSAIGAAPTVHASQHEANGTDPIKKINMDAYGEKVAALTGTAIDFDIAPVLTYAATGNTTFTSITATFGGSNITGDPGDDGSSWYCKTGILLLTTGPTAPTITFPSNVVWADDEVEIKANSMHEIVFRRYGSSQKWIASCAATISTSDLIDNSLLG